MWPPTRNVVDELLNAAWRAQQSRRQRQDCPYKLQNTVDGNADDPEWEQKQPHKGIQHQAQQCQRPAEHKEDAPHDESEHGSSSASGYEVTKREVPYILQSGDLVGKAYVLFRAKDAEAAPDCEAALAYGSSLKSFSKAERHDKN
jgi:hypothetical protein